MGTSKRISYGPAPSQFADLRLPEATGPHPLVVLFHGGFWRAAYGLEPLDALATALTRECGVATWNVEYRRVGEPGGGWPGTFDDAVSAMGAVPVDDSRVVLLGFSAGGQLALWLARRVAALGVVALAPVSDLERAAQLGMNRGIVPELLGGTAVDVPERYAAASPARLLPLGVRQVLVHGTEDDQVPLALSESYVERARAAGDLAELRTLEGANHFDLMDVGSRCWPIIRDAVVGLLGPTLAL
jgi:acetyl esterase/lipase